jgi:hypothetical protein
MRSTESQEKLNYYSEQLYVARSMYCEAKKSLEYSRKLVATYQAKYNFALRNPDFDLFTEMFETN